MKQASGAQATINPTHAGTSSSGSPKPKPKTGARDYAQMGMGALGQFGQDMTPSVPFLQGAPMADPLNPGQKMQMPQLPFGGYLARGGRTKPKTAYVVGENGPEMFVPDEEGTVVPHLSPEQQLQKTLSNPQMTPDPSQQLNRTLTQYPRPEAAPAPDQQLYNTLKVAPDQPSMDAPQVSGPPQLASRPRVVPPPSEDDLLDKYRAEKAALIQRGEKHVSKGASALYYLFKGMERFANPSSEPITPLGQVRQQEDLNRVNRKIAPILEQKKIDQEMQMGQAKIANERAKTAQETIKAIQAQNPHLYDVAIKDGVIDEEDQKAIYQAGYGYVPLGDFRKFVFKDSNGISYASPEVGAPNFQQVPGIMPDAGKYETPLTTEIDGIPVHTTGNQELERRNRIKVANAQYQGAAQERNRVAAYTYQKEDAAAKTEKSNVASDSATKADQANNILNEARAIETDIAIKTNDLNQMMANPDRDAVAVSQLQKEIADLKEKARKRRTDGENLLTEARNPKKVNTPVVPPTSQPPVITPNKVTGSDKTLNEREIQMMMEKSKKSREEIIQKAIQKGYTILN